jgi:hypothetical protein
MNLRRSRPVPAGKTMLAVPLLLPLAGCLGVPDLEASRDPLVVTVEGESRAGAAASPERLAAVAEMRAKGEAAEAAGFPDVFQSARTARLASREEPRSVADTEAIEAELADLARRRSRATSPGEIAELEARAEALRRLAARGQAQSLRR